MVIREQRKNGRNRVELTVHPLRVYPEPELGSRGVSLFASYRGEIATNRGRLLGSRAAEFGVTSRVNQR